MGFFELTAPLYDLAMKAVGHGESLEELMEVIEPQSGDKLLDLGGGTGQLLEYVPEKVGVTLADSSESMLKRAEKKDRHPRTEYVLASGDDLPMNSGIFDYVVVADALHHMERVDDTIAEVARILNEQGELYILEFLPGSFLTGFVRVGESLFGEPVNFFEPEKLADVCRDKGLDAEYEEITSSLYILRAFKQ
ncbi:class I SAM-dependent methyltransferase [Halarsenatibacter silvermanii]|uniref:Demethylmenaquinone methyltransferase / 2-methoxy-6-polyprenyl-1,4-benzoquinol methylase n=1 Tax=Halarsenatibacter silvermanii TaxID=321763 RepID=A0A1G9PVK7_9FIRM|nr:methyltransferase domain-containing protein [Halarsenatibacter silvermanii]SDM02784.1 demethylmenaquinone methyltransferase / 2-methoxy-6-polyprenyl-1,4-benzoquinol methylase [Halarsenatibacter silvermanii]